MFINSYLKSIYKFQINLIFYYLCRLVYFADNILTTRSVFIPGYSTSSLEEAYKKSDLVIAKGVFNFESLAGEDLEKPVVYMLKIKCRLLSGINEAEMGNAIVRLGNA